MSEILKLSDFEARRIMSNSDLLINFCLKDPKQAGKLIDSYAHQANSTDYYPNYICMMYLLGLIRGMIFNASDLKILRQNITAFANINNLVLEAVQPDEVLGPKRKYGRTSPANRPPPKGA